MTKLKNDPKYGDFKELFDELFDERLEAVLKTKMNADAPKTVDEPKPADAPKNEKNEKSFLDMIFGG